MAENVNVDSHALMLILRNNCVVLLCIGKILVPCINEDFVVWDLLVGIIMAILI